MSDLIEQRWIIIAKDLAELPSYRRRLVIAKALQDAYQLGQREGFAQGERSEHDFPRGEGG